MSAEGMLGVTQYVLNNLLMLIPTKMRPNDQANKVFARRYLFGTGEGAPSGRYSADTTAL